jgi:S1-C subfamily serine protease
MNEHGAAAASETSQDEVSRVRMPPIPVIVHLSGSRRGATQRLRGDLLRIGTGVDVEVRVSPEPSVRPRHATLHRRGNTYELLVEPRQEVWLNGEKVHEAVLASGDVLEIGQDGPILRFRLYAAGTPAAKTLSEAFSDCVDCARYGASSPVGRATAFLTGVPKEIATQTSLTFRMTMLTLIALLLLSTGLLTWRSLRLEKRLTQGEVLVRGITEMLDTGDNRDLSLEELAEIRDEVATTLERVKALEERSGAPARVVASASRAIVLLQGSYGFIEPKNGQPLRFMGLGDDGLPLRDATGAPVVGLGGSGPVVESLFTGTAFVASGEGLLLTNRHVALPWDYDPAAQAAVLHGLQPAMRRFLGYLPGTAESFDVQLEMASNTSDLAVLRCSGVTGRVSPLNLVQASPAAGDEVIVLGYPTGIRALLARADEAFVDQLMQDQALDFWAVARRLAAAGHIAPLASRGIVAQVAPAAVVYDAETTRGGSGGPVLNLNGKVVAVTSAIVPEFGGSNLGVPAQRARRLLTAATLRRMMLRVRLH